ncbi:MAG: carboxymuconolactone decarboxylase family protein [Jiangellaceae bacterium]
MFADIWSRPGLAIRDRRLLLIGLASMLGRADIIETLVYGALGNRELSSVELDEIVLQMHFYAGWPNGTQVRAGVERATARFNGSGTEQPAQD